jgi:hypothetical protein
MNERTFTYFELSELIDQAVEKSLLSVNEENLIADHMNKSFNNGVRYAGCEIRSLILNKIMEEKEKAVSA